jgi:ABC-type antimicrobial peptide transport system permease subunit
MIKNYLKVAWRNITRNKIYTTINVLGLALGISCCLFILLWVQDEKGVDNFHRKGENLFSIYKTVTANGKVEGDYFTPLRLYKDGDAFNVAFVLEDLKQAVPEVKYQAFYTTGYELPWGHPETFQVGDKKLKLEGARAGEDFFKMFSYPLIEGSAERALKDVNGIAISRKMANIFFGSPHKALGKTMRYENKLNFVVTAVFEDLPEQSALKFDFLFNWDAQKKVVEWASSNFRTFIQLSENADVKKVEAKINKLLQVRLQKYGGSKTDVGLQHYRDQYLYGSFVNGKPSGGRIEYVRIFSGVAIFILIIACINFMNLATARSIKRAREIGLRKVVGSTRGNLIGQFLGESLLFSMLATVLSLILVIALLPAFNNFTGKRIAFPFAHGAFWAALAGLMLITGLVAGSYPALYLSSLKPVRTLKGVFRFTRGSIWFRKGLTVFQFAMSIMLLIATIVISRQTVYVQRSNLGYDRENLIYIRIEGELTNRKNYLLFKEQASQMPGIAMIDRSTEAPHQMSFLEAGAINWEGKQEGDVISFYPSSVGFDFIRLMKLGIAEGRDFSRLNATDSADAFMVNEEAVRQMGMKNPIGKWVSAWKKKGHIIAVLKDFHTHSLHEPIKPLIIDVKEYEYFGVIIVRTQAGKTRQALASLEKVYNNINPNYPFVYQFVDQEYQRLYNSELIMSRLSVLFAILAILISCLGLLGLVIFSAEQRIREMGIRKVLGASLTQIIASFSTDFLKLVLVAFLIAAPLAWYAMSAWLQGFAYRISLSWWIFAVAGIVSLAIALLTVSYQAVKAAMTNPIKSLRTE